jgi:hypothetical protein
MCALLALMMAGPNGTVLVSVYHKRIGHCKQSSRRLDFRVSIRAPVFGLFACVSWRESACPCCSGAFHQKNLFGAAKNILDFGSRE